MKAVALDAQGAQFITGSTRSTFANFPQSNGTEYWSSVETMFLTRFHPNNFLDWTDFFGGTTDDQVSNSVAIRNAAVTQVFIGGTTDAADFEPFEDGTAYQGTTPTTGRHGILARFTASTGQMEWSAYFGTGGFSVEDIAIDPSGQLLAVGSTTGNLPQHEVTLPPGSEAWSYSGTGVDGWIAKFTLDEQVLWSTYVGGSSWDTGSGVCSKGNKIIMTGVTQSSSIHNEDPSNGAYYQGANGGGAVEVFLKEFDTNCSQQWGTFVGGNGADATNAAGVDIDPGNGDVFITGTTSSTNLEYENGDGWYDNSFGGIQDGFLAQFDGTDRSPLWLTYVGGGGDDGLNSVAVSPTHRILLCGAAESTPFLYHEYAGLYAEEDLIGDRDGVVLLFDGEHELLWGTYFGGLESNHVEYCVQAALEQDASVYLLGATNALYNPDNDLYFPLTNPQTGAWFDDDFGEFEDGFFSRFCIEGPPTDIGERPDHYGISAQAQWDGTILINGLDPLQKRVTVFDSAGRMVWCEDLLPTTGSAILGCKLTGQGIYWVHVDHTAKVLAVVKN